MYFNIFQRHSLWSPHTQLLHKQINTHPDLSIDPDPIWGYLTYSEQEWSPQTKSLHAGINNHFKAEKFSTGTL